MCDVETDRGGRPDGREAIRSGRVGPDVEDDNRGAARLNVGASGEGMPGRCGNMREVLVPAGPTLARKGSRIEGESGSSWPPRLTGGVSSTSESITHDEGEKTPWDVGVVVFWEG